MAVPHNEMHELLCPHPHPAELPLAQPDALSLPIAGERGRVLGT